MMMRAQSSLLIVLTLSGVWWSEQSFLSNAPDAPYGCCRICARHIDNELSFLSISEEKLAQTRKNLQNWIDANSFLQVETAAECCHICVTSFVPDNELSVSAHQAASMQNSFTFTMIPGMRDPRKKGAVAVPEEPTPGFLEIMPGITKFGPGSCCNICPRSLISPSASKAGGGAASKAGVGGMTGASAAAGGSKNHVAKKGSKVPGMGGGARRTEGGCCTLCPSRFYGPQVYGAPPFSEPGNREQNIVAGSLRGLYRPDGLHPRINGLTPDTFNNNPMMYNPQASLLP